ncbi:hypothetical protein HK105_203462 [Polyrhizophydium stewartii]|uniref:SH3 domain-containing protein n=1 Tax=Polyrhizophydium stewartii TaxID=2732419 RepID=A0ABR4NBV9_9FUNG
MLPFAAATLLLAAAAAAQAPADSPAPAPAADSPAAPPAATVPTGAPAECLAVDATTACAPLARGFFINATALAEVYGLRAGTAMTAPLWDALVRNSTSGGATQARLWRDWAYCPGYLGQPIQFLRTYTCLTDLLEYSRGCNARASSPALAPPAAAALPPVCGSACAAYGQAAARLMADPAACPADLARLPPQARQDVLDRRASVAESAATCAALVAAADFDTSKPCLDGVGEDQLSCGFNGNLEITAEYCRAAPNATCCESFANKAAVGARFDRNDELERLRAGIEVKLSSDDSAPASGSGSSQSLWSHLRHAAMVADVPSRLAAMHAAADGSASPSGSTASSPSGLSPVGVLILAVAGGALVAFAGFAIFIGVAWSRRQSRQTAATGAFATGGKGAGTPLVSGGAPQSGFAAGAQPAAAVYGSTQPAAVPSSGRCVVILDYQPVRPDEVALRVGDTFDIEVSFDDGWCEGTNVTTGEKGVCPRDHMQTATH